MTHRLLPVVCMLALAVGFGCSPERRGDAERTADRAAERGEGAMGEAGEAIGDAALTARVKAQLAADEGLRTLTGINVDSENGRVRLSGTVPTQDAKQRAERVASQADGVRSVENNLKVEAAPAR